MTRPGGLPGTLVVTGTGTGVGKTVVTAAIAAVAADRGVDVTVVKPAQTGTRPDEPGDLEEIRRLADVRDLHEFARFPAALSPEAAARVARLPYADLSEADLARALGAPVVVVTTPDLAPSITPHSRWKP